MNEIDAGACYTRDTVMQKLQQGYNYSYAASWDLENKLIQTFFSFDETTKTAQNRFPGHIPQLPSICELQWLKNLLLDENFSFLLTPALHQKLAHCLENVAPLFSSVSWQKLQNTGDDTSDPRLCQYLRTLQQAFLEQRQIDYVNKDCHGKLHTGTVSPCRLEYDLKGNKYRIIIWNETEQRAIKMNLANLQKLSLSSRAILPCLSEKLNLFFQQHQTIISLSLENKVNAVERCFLLFSSYDKETFVDDDRQTYTLKITCYDFDRYELLEKILSLGSAVTVLAPNDFHQEIIQRLKTAYEYYR